MYGGVAVFFMMFAQAASVDSCSSTDKEEKHPPRKRTEPWGKQTALEKEPVWGDSCSVTSACAPSFECERNDCLFAGCPDEGPLQCAFSCDSEQAEEECAELDGYCASSGYCFPVD
jgi:hypothetical protein